MLAKIEFSYKAKFMRYIFSSRHCSQKGEPLTKPLAKIQQIVAKTDSCVMWQDAHVVPYYRI